MGREDVNACVSFSKGGNGVLGWAGEGWGAGSGFGQSPLTFPELLRLVSPLFHFVLIDEPGRE